MSNDWQADVRAFHEKFGVPVAVRPSIPDFEERLLRKRLITEEIFFELFEAIDRDDLIGIADGIADAIYVLLGTALAYGVEIQPVWDLVQESNMAKEGGRTREDGKILKPPGWKSPDIAGELLRQIRRYKEKEGVSANR